MSAPSLELGANLAKPLGNAWRNRIMMELHFLHSMSPKQFAEELSGPGLASIARYFRELKNWGLLEVAEELQGGKRRGAVEKILRPTHRAHFDTPTWAALPHHLRCECSSSIMEGLMLRVTQAVRAGTFGTKSDGHFSWRNLVFDRDTWSEYVTRLDDLLNWVGVVEIESADRIAKAKDELFPATVAHLAFRSPSQPNSAKGLECLGESTELPSTAPGPHFLMSPYTAKTLANPWRSRILTELHERPMSPKQFLEELGGPDLTTIGRYFRQLRKWGYLDVIEELRGGNRRGSVEKVYRATRRSHFTRAPWEALPPELRANSSVASLDGLVGRINEAIGAETFDMETDRHLSWKGVCLDGQAWTEYVTRLGDLLTWIDELAIQAAERLNKGKGEPIPTTVALMAFRSPETGSNQLVSPIPVPSARRQPSAQPPGT